MNEGSVGPSVRKTTQVEEDDVSVEGDDSEATNTETGVTDVQRTDAAATPAKEAPVEAPEPLPSVTGATHAPQTQAEVPTSPGSPDGDPPPTVNSEPAGASARRRVVDVTSGLDSPVMEQEAIFTPEPVVDEAEYDRLESDFASMFERTISRSRPEVGPGDKVSGRVVLIGDDNVFIDLAGKTEGFLPRSQVAGDDGELTVSVGDELEAYYVRLSPSGVELTLALGSSGGASEDELHRAWQGRLPVEGKVSARNKGGYEVSVFGLRAFCPISQIELDYTEDADAHVNMTYRFLITKVEGAGKKCNVVVSRAELLREERAGLAAKTLSSLKAGLVMAGTVRRIAPFGAFVDVGGIDGLVHISEMGWSRTVDPSDIVSVGQIVQVEVLSVETADDPGKTRVSLSMKSVGGSPWDTIGETFTVGGIYPGNVVRIQPFGVFVELAPGLDGLVHISELSQRRIGHPNEVVTDGQAVQVEVLSIDPLKRRISLSMKTLDADPWDGVLERYPMGKSVAGVVENIEDFGVFVELEPGLTALLPLSEMSSGGSPRRRFRKGDSMEATVLSVDPSRRRLSLTLLSADEREELGRSRGTGERPESERAETSQQEQTMGTLGDLFAAKLRRK